MRDFYADVEAGTVPQYDILVTNPPFSGDHKERILKFCLKSGEKGCNTSSTSHSSPPHTGKPFALLMPNYVANKSYFKAAVQGQASSAAVREDQTAERGDEAGPSTSGRPPSAAAAALTDPFFVVPAVKYEYHHPEDTGHDSSPFFSIWCARIEGDPRVRRLEVHDVDVSSPLTCPLSGSCSSGRTREKCCSGGRKRSGERSVGGGS